MNFLQRAIGAVVVFCGAWGAAGLAQEVRIELKEIVAIEDRAVDQHGQAFTIGGLSGIAYVGGDEYLAVMDNSDKLVRLTIAVEEDGTSASVQVAGGITLAERRDFEGIVYGGGERGSVFLSEEGTPAVREYRLADGAPLGALPTPGVFARGLRGNFGFEALTGGGDELWTANEEALKTDGERSTAKAGSTVRLLRIVLRDGRWAPREQYAYVTDPIHKRHNPDDRGLSRSGLVELVLLPDGRLLALERSFALLGPRNVLSDFRNSIYLVDLAEATDISVRAFKGGLRQAEFQPVSKSLIWNYQGMNVGNLEGLCVGPKLGPGRWAMIGVVDNGGIPAMANRVVLFELTME